MPYKIVIADDETHILNIVSLKLKNAGHEVYPAEDGGAAYEQVVRQRPDLLITDFHMPTMTGVELCRRLREEGRFTGPAVLLTARGGDIPAEELAGAGIVEVVSKPFSPRLLADVVARHLAAKAA